MQQQESLVVCQAVVIYQGFQAHAIRNFPQNRLIFSSSTLWEETSDFASRAVWEAAEKFQQGLASFSVTQLVPSSVSCLFVSQAVCYGPRSGKETQNKSVRISRVWPKQSTEQWTLNILVSSCLFESSVSSQCRWNEGPEQHTTQEDAW